MPNIAVCNVDDCGTGLIRNTQGIRCTIGGNAIAVRGDSVDAHPPCPDQPAHCNATTQGASSGLTINGIPIIREGDLATCGHPATGSTNTDNN